MKKIKLLLTSLITLIGLNAALLAPIATVKAATTTTNGLTCGTQLDLNTDGECAVDTTKAGKVNDTLTKVVRLFEIIVGIVSVIMIIFGGLKYITSGGETGGVKKAKDTILYAVIGLVVVAISESIVQFVLQRFNS